MANRSAIEEAKTESELREEVAQLKEDLAAIREDFRGVVSEAVRTGKRGFESASGSVRSAAHNAAERAQHYAERSSAMGRDAIHKTEHQVAEHPFASLATAFAGGAILGALLGRHRS